MAQVDAIRNGIIDKIMAISDKEYLIALNRLIENSSTQNNRVKLTKEQQLMLQMSELDIEEGRIITQKELDRNDLEWLKSR